LYQAIKRIETKIIKRNRDQIFEDSSDIFGQPIGFYSFSTEVITKGAKKQGEPFDLFDTGDFLNSLFIDIRDGNVFFGAKDPKLGLIFENLLSTDIFGLTEKNLNETIRKDLLPIVQNEIRKVLQV